MTAEDLAGQLGQSASGGPSVVADALQWDEQSGAYSPVVPGQTVSAGAVLWVKAESSATVSIVGTYTEPVNRQLPPGGAFLASAALEAWSPNLPPTLTAWTYNSAARQWHAQLNGDLAFLTDLPPTLTPGEALYVLADAPAELEVPDAALRIRFYHQDHLGSSSVMTDAEGALVEETAFYPFGIPRHEHRLRQVEEAYKFTQKERDRESGLHYFEARYLTGGLARFMIQDPMYANPDALAAEDAAAFLATPQKMNMYAYARNNPLSYVDPTGLEVEGIVSPPLQDEEESTLLKIGRVAANISAGAADALPIEGGLNRNAALFKATGMANEDSGVYKVSYWTTFVASLAIPVGGAANAARGGKAAISGGEAANVAKSVVDPLAKTPFVTDAYRTTQAAVSAPKALSKGAITPVSTGGGASAIRSAQAAQRAAVAASNAQVAAYIEILKPIQAANLHLVKSGVHPSTVLNMSFQQASAVWMSKFGTRPPGL